MSVKPGKLLSGEDLLQSHICNDRTLPKIGEKHFKATNSWLEKKQVQAALEENKHLLEEERVERFGDLAQAVWINSKKLAEVTRKVGKFFHTMGFERDGKLFIYPEEALYLMEVNSLQLKYDGVPLSIQEAYSLLLSSPGCSLKEYRTYSHLSKQGYRLLRYTKTGMPTNYEHRIRLDQHVPHKRVFPEVTVEPICSDAAGSSGTSVREYSPPASIDSSKATDSPVKSEKDSVDVSEPMKDFAKSIADMGKFLVKNEKDGGSDGLGFESLRKKILDMLEDHFQGQISPEAMDAVSLSASKVIMVHVEDNDSKKSFAKPLSESNDKSLCSPSSSISNIDCSVRSDGKSPDDQGSPDVISASDSDAGVSGQIPEEVNRKKTDEEAQKSGVQELKKTTLIRAELAAERIPGQESEGTENKREEEAGRIPDQKSDEADEKRIEKEPREAAKESAQDGAKKRTVQELKGAAEKETGEALEKRMDQKPEEATQESAQDGTVKRRVQELEGAAEKEMGEALEKRMDQEPEEATQESAQDGTKKRRVQELEGAAEKETAEEFEKRMDQEPEEATQESAQDVAKKRTVQELDGATEKETGEALEKRMDQEPEEATQESGQDGAKKRTVQELEGAAEKETAEALEKRMDQEPEEVTQESAQDVAKKRTVQELDGATEKETGEALEKRMDQEPEEATQESAQDVAKKRTVQESEGATEKETGEELEKRLDKEPEEAAQESAQDGAKKRRVQELKGAAEKRTEEAPRKGIDQESEKSSGERKEGAPVEIDTETEVSTTDEKTSGALKIVAKTSNKKCDSSKEPSNIQLSKPLPKTGTQRKESGQGIVLGSEEDSDGEIDFEEEMELDEYPVEGTCSDEDSSADESDILQCKVSQADLQVDDDVLEIENPNTWKNVKVEKSPDKDNDSQKRLFSDSNGWRSFKKSQSTASPMGTHCDDDEVDIVAVKNAKDIEVEVIDITEESSVKSTQGPVHPKEEIEIVDLDESDSSSSCSSGMLDIKQKNLAKQRPKLASAFERARDNRRKFIMNAFPNMFNKTLCHIDVPPRHLLPPNVSPVKPSYVIDRRVVSSERPQSVNPPRRPFNLPRFNNYYNNHPRPYHPRPPFKPPVNRPPWQGRPPAQINPAAMQAFQMITSIVLPMFGMNNMGPTFMGQPQWNQAPMWQQPQRNWQNHQQWRFGQRQSNHWNNRFNRPWHNRNSDREQQDVFDRRQQDVFDRRQQDVLDRPQQDVLDRPQQDVLDRPQQDVLDRPKRPALLPTPGISSASLVWQMERSIQEQRRPKRPFVVENSARELLLDIEDEVRWNKIRRMEEESDSDSESEVTITPINRTPKTSDVRPLLRFEHCKSSSDIMASINVIKRADPRSLNASTQNRILKISYDLFLPNVPFKKSSPPTPNFRLCVMSAEEPVPNPGEISLLLDSIHDGVPMMFAIVNPDMISFYQYSNVDVPKQSFSS